MLINCKRKCNCLKKNDFPVNLVTILDVDFRKIHGSKSYAKFSIKIFAKITDFSVNFPILSVD